jgi:16S rRNA (guanine527-N7)-methyltransferase
VNDPRLERFCDLVTDAPVRLTAVPREEAYERHVADALAGLPLVDATHGPIVDVGSGTGVPGLVLALVRPDRPVHLVESVQKKAAMLREIATRLDAGNVDVHDERAEELARGPARDAYGLAVCRALAPPPVAVELCLPLVREGGTLLIWAGAVDDDAVARTARAVGGDLVRIEPAPGHRRAIVVVAKTAPTPTGFPRRTGLAAKRPLAP